MTKPHIRLRLVPRSERPLAALSKAEKLAQAKAYLQRRGLWILDRGTPRPGWGVAGEMPAEKNPLMEQIMALDRWRK